MFDSTVKKEGNREILFTFSYFFKLEFRKEKTNITSLIFFWIFSKITPDDLPSIKNIFFQHQSTISFPFHSLNKYLVHIFKRTSTIYIINFLVKHSIGETCFKDSRRNSTKKTKPKALKEQEREEVLYRGLSALIYYSYKDK